MALLVVAIIAAAMLYVGFHMARRNGPEAPAILGKTTPAPDFTLQSLDGKSLTLSDLKGKAVLLNFWATWCGPCKIETPWLVEMQNEYGKTACKWSASPWTIPARTRLNSSRKIWA